MKKLFPKYINKLISKLSQLPWRKTLLFLVFVFLGILAIVYTLNWIPTRDFITILPALKIVVLILFISGIFVLFFRRELNIEKYQGVVNILLIVVTIGFTFSAYFIDKQNIFYNTNTSLVRVNEINNEIAVAIMQKDYSKGYPWVFFLTEPYERNIAFITKNFTSSDCVTKYYRLMLETRILNDVHSSIIMNVVEEASISELVFNKASSITNLINQILKECHPSGSSSLD